MANFTLKYGSTKHDEIRDAIRARIRHGQHAISKKTEDYAEDEERFMAYMPTREDDVARKVKKDNGEPQFVTLDIPYSYAILLSWHTYQSSVFLSRSPVMQFSGRHGESEQQVQAMEAIMDYQTQVGEHLVPYYIWLMDAGKYGVGVVGNYWDEEIIQVSEIAEEEVTYLGIPISGKTRKVKKTKRVKGYTGNRLYNIRPQDFIFDSRVSLLNFQKGEFCGRYFDLAWNNLVRREDYGQYYNIDDLKRIKKKKHRSQGQQGERDTGSSQLELPDAVTNENSSLQDELKSPDFVGGVEMTIDIIPKDWGLGQSRYPEKWVFTLAEDEVIIESQPYDSLHGKFPYNVLEHEMEGYALQKHSMLETMDPLNDTLSWLVNSHLYNVRSVLNGQFIADPSRITLKDFKSEGGGRIVRLKPTAYGQDVRTMFQQINTTDVTQNHLRDAQVIAEMLQRVSGVTDNIMGQPNAGGRKTATEVRGSNAASINRLRTQAEYFSASGWGPLAQMMVQNTQQKYDGEMKFKLAGDLTQDAGAQFMNVNPEMIGGFYDFVPVDGTLPVDRFAQVTMWTQLMAQMRNFPQIMTEYDMGGIFSWVAQLGGLKNIKRFKLNVRPDGAIGRDLQAGNVIGLNDARGSSAGNGGSPQNSTGVPGAPQVPGLGPSG
jgi:hypothetical protein